MTSSYTNLEMPSEKKYIPTGFNLKVMVILNRQHVFFYLTLSFAFVTCVWRLLSHGSHHDTFQRKAGYSPEHVFWVMRSDRKSTGWVGAGDLDLAQPCCLLYDPVNPLVVVLPLTDRAALKRILIPQPQFSPIKWGWWSLLPQSGCEDSLSYNKHIMSA